MSVTKRLLTRAGFHGGALDRHLDRREARCHLTIFMILVIVVGPATWFVASTVGRTGAQQERTQHADRHRVTATLLARAPFPVAGAGSPAFKTPVLAQWRTAQGPLRSGVITAAPGTAAGSTVTIWTDNSGNLTRPPIRHADAVASVWGSVFLVLALFAATAAGVTALIHRRFDRRRFEQWEQEWTLVEPDWSRLC
jgi:hypothetical protein